MMELNHSSLIDNLDGIKFKITQSQEFFAEKGKAIFYLFVISFIDNDNTRNLAYSVVPWRNWKIKKQCYIHELKNSEVLDKIVAELRKDKLFCNYFDHFNSQLFDPNPESWTPITSETRKSTNYQPQLVSMETQSMEPQLVSMETQLLSMETPFTLLSNIEPIEANDNNISLDNAIDNSNINYKRPRDASIQVKLIFFYYL